MKARFRHSVEWRDDHLEVIDQTLLPDLLEIRVLRTVDDVIDAISRLVVRGAPAIGVCGAYGVVLGLAAGGSLDVVADRIANARPTAVNLRWAVERVATAARTGPPDDAVSRALEQAMLIQDEDREACRRIGEFGTDGTCRVEPADDALQHRTSRNLWDRHRARRRIREVASGRAEIEVIATETRPLLQGARLTAWELADAGIPVTLIADAAAGAALTYRTRRGGDRRL